MKSAYLFIVLVLAFGFLGCTDSEAQGCFDKPSGYERDSCFLGLAKARNDTLLCDMLSDSRNSCFTQVATMAKDPSICEKIEAGYERDRCYATVGKNTKNTSTCDSITYVALKNECYYSGTETTPSQVANEKSGTGVPAGRTPSGWVPNPNTYPEYYDQNNPIHKAVILHRRHLNCQDDTPYQPSMNGQYEQVIRLVDENGNVLYSNYICRNRKQEQCYEDGSFDTYYDEWCEDAQGNRIEVPN
jgi:hypothetical protein